jgi:predicted GNAT family N-acyltransferase
MRTPVRFEVVSHGSDTYREAVELRDDLLRNPMGMVTTREEQIAERDLIHVAGLRGGVVCATCLLVLQGSSMRMKRVAVAAAVQNSGIGSDMLRFCEELALAHGAGEMVAHARKPAIRFYEKAGYVAEGDFFDEVGIPHRVVRKALAD